MDLSDVLDETVSVPCEFLGKTVVAHVYTAGIERLTKEEREQLNALDNRTSPNVPELSEEDLAKLTETELEERKARQWEGYAQSVDALRIVLPLALKGWDYGDSSMTLRGNEFPPTAENMQKCPDGLLLAVGGEVVPRWNKANPTTGAAAPTGSEQTESVKDQSLPIENTLLSSESVSPPDGSTLTAVN